MFSLTKKYIKKIKSFVCRADLDKVIHAFISSRLDWCNSFYSCLTKKINFMCTTALSLEKCAFTQFYWIFIWNTSLFHNFTSIRCSASKISSLNILLNENSLELSKSPFPQTECCSVFNRRQLVCEVVFVRWFLWHYLLLNISLVCLFRYGHL